MKKTVRFFIVCLVVLLTLSACSTTKSSYRNVVAFDLNGGQFVEGEIERYYKESEKNSDPALPEVRRTGYEFTGWTTKEEPERDGDGRFTGTVTYTAGWKLCTYSIKYMSALVDSTYSSEVEIPVITGYPTSYTVEDVGTALPDPSADGFIFVGWKDLDDTTGKPEKNYVLKEGISGDKTAVAYWEVKYDIVYDLDGLVTDDLKDFDVLPKPKETEKQKNPDYYTTFDEVSFGAPERAGFTFIGWVEKDEEADETSPLSGESDDLNAEEDEIDKEKEEKRLLASSADANYMIKKGSRGDKELVAVWSRNTYSVSYDLGGGKCDTRDPSSFLYGSAAFPLSVPEKDYYVFYGWKDKDNGKIYHRTFDGTFTARNVTLEAQWKPVAYSITYDLDGGHFEGDEVVSYTYETPSFTLAEPVKDGFVFLGWESDKIAEADPLLFSLFFSIQGVDAEIYVRSSRTDIVLPLYATEEAVENVRKYLEKEFPSSKATSYHHIITLEYSFSDSSTVEKLVRKCGSELGFVFADYSDVTYPTVTKAPVVISLGSHGDRTYKALWSVVTYSIGYGEEEEYGPRIASYSPFNPTSYTAEDEIELVNPYKFGYDFMGWVLEDEDYTYARTDRTIRKGSTGDRVYTPLFRLHNYVVDLALDGGEIDTVQTYTIEDPQFVIGEPERYGYEFVGWLAEDGSVRRSVTVDPSKGMDCILSALWEGIEYSISYDLDGGYFPLSDAENPENYTLDDDPFVLINPVRDNYDFAGWVIEGREGKDYPLKAYKFNTQKGGDVALRATWKEKTYTITYDLRGGLFDYADSSPFEFRSSNSSFVIANPKKDGHRFLGWVRKGFEQNRPVVNYVINPQTEKNDVALVAVWSEAQYRISYNLNGGSYRRGDSPNALFYSASSSPFTLTNPVRKGYEFAGWSSSVNEEPSLTYVVDTKKGGDLTLDAHWTPLTYSITYYLDGGEYRYDNSNPEEYTPQDSFLLSQPHKDGYSFLGWIRSGDPTEAVVPYAEITEGTSGNLSFYAVYEKSYVPVGVASEMQKSKAETGEDGIPRPDWVVSLPLSPQYFFARAYSTGSDFLSAYNSAVEKGREELAGVISTSVSNVKKDINGSKIATKTVEVSSTVNGSEVVEYWVDGNGGVWVLMRVGR